VKVRAFITLLKSGFLMHVINDSTQSTWSFLVAQKSKATINFRPTMVASAVFITDLSGKSIISRNYRGDVPLTKALERFSKYLVDTDEEQKKPVFHVDDSGDTLMGEDVGCTGPGGETYIYVQVSTSLALWLHLVSLFLAMLTILPYSTTAQQSLFGSRHSQEFQCCPHSYVPLPASGSLQGLFWKPRGRVYPG
jgi:hypothetical protein